MKPDFQIPGYLNRWHLIPRNKWFNIYLHQFIGPDPSEYLHDHPWWSMSIVLRGKYLEQGARWLSLLEGRIIVREPSDSHIIFGPYISECWTLFITGPVVRDWGFWVDGKWMKHTDYLDPIQDGEMPSPPPKMSAITKARLIAAHMDAAAHHTRRRLWRC